MVSALHKEVIEKSPCGGVPVNDLEVPLDQLRATLHREQTRYGACKDYLHSLAVDSDGVTEGWRRRICEWIFQVVDHFSFDREVVSIALDFLDRTVSLITSESSRTTMSKREFQLIAVTSLYIAIKLHGETDVQDGPRLKLKISAFHELSRGFFEVKTIEAMEARMLSLLKWRMHPPTSTQFIALMLRLLPRWNDKECSLSYREVTGRIFDVSKYLSELSCFDSSLSFQSKPSIVAYASILCAIDSIAHSMPLPYKEHLLFVRNINMAHKMLAPNTPQVVSIQAMLKDLAPELFSTPKLTRTVSLLDSDTESDSKSTDSPTRWSPVTVCDNVVHSQPRKRIRTQGP